MLNQTARQALRLLIFLSKEGGAGPVPLSRIREALGGSPTYLPKVIDKLATRGILKTFRGSQGGVVLGREPGAVTLLSVVEACQGPVLEDYCDCPMEWVPKACAFHQAMWEVRQGVVSTLSKWTLKDLKERPLPDLPASAGLECRMRSSP
jgi:Rrf2 family protein